MVKQEGGEADKLYLVRETKSTKEQLQLRGSEWAKIQCGIAHSAALDLSFKHITSAARCDFNRSFLYWIFREK